MEYRGPEQDDFHNVRSLNRECLTRLAGGDPHAAPLEDMPERLALRLVRLRPAQCERLAATPFLLFSFRERDNEYWGRLLDDTGTRNLFSAGAEADDVRMPLIAAGLGFVWQLARRNPYAARLICGASLHWCEQLAERTLLEVVTVAASCPDVLVMREAGNRPLWNKLLQNGISYEPEVRRAAHIGALQYVLTSVSRGDAARTALAARAGLAPTMRVADKTER